MTYIRDERLVHICLRLLFPGHWRDDVQLLFVIGRNLTHCRQWEVAVCLIVCFVCCDFHG